MEKADRPFTTAECKQFFDFIDEDGSGSIDLSEIQRLLRILGMDDDVTFARRVMQEANVSRDAEISWNDFYNTVNPKKSSQFSNQEVQRAFQFFSGKDSPPNKIHKAALEQILRECRPEREVKTMMQQLPFDGQGYLNYTDFVNMYN